MKKINVIMNCREVRQKDNIKFNHENKTVSYLQRRLWYFDAKQSNGSLNDIITNLDIVAVVSCLIASVIACIQQIKFSISIIIPKSKNK